MRDTVVAATPSEPAYRGYGVARPSSLANAATSTSTSASTASWSNCTRINPCPGAAPVMDRICFAALSTVNMPGTPDRSNLVRGSDVTSIVRPAYSSSTTMIASVASPAAAPGSPGTTKSAGDSTLAEPSIRTVADIALGNDTLANA